MLLTVHSIARRFRCCWAWLLLATASLPLLAQADGEALEARLPEAVGSERLDILMQLIDQNSADAPRLAIEWGQEASLLLQEISDPEREMILECRLCEAYNNLREFDTALGHGARCQELAEERADKSWLAWSYHHCTGDAHYRSNTHDLAIEHYHESMELYEELGDDLNVARALNFVAFGYRNRGDYARALEHLVDSHQILVRLESDDEQMRTLASVLNAMGSVHRQLKQPDRALERYGEALEIARALNDRSWIARVLNNIGVLHRYRNDPERALEYLFPSLEIKRELGEKPGIARRLRNIGVCYTDLGQLEEARPYLENGLRGFEELGDQREIAISHLELARLYRKHGDLQLAIASLERALSASEEADAEVRLVQAYRELAELYDETGRSRDAFQLLLRYGEIQTRNFNEQQAKSLAEMQVRFDTERKERQIELLQKDQTLSRLELERQRNGRYAILVGFAATLVLLFLLFTRYRYKARAEALTQVTARLRELDRLKDDFLANTSHELRTPLYGIVGLAESLLDGATGRLGQATRHNLQMIVASGRRLGHLVNDILDFSKLRHKNLELDCQPVDLHALVDVILTLSEPLVEDKPLRLVNEIPEDLPPAHADEGRLQQILHNLVGNAVKFTEEGTVAVAARHDGERLWIEVRDTGIGIAEDKQERIFDAFEQADGSVEREYGGTGLGLAVTRQLVELHGGSISVESSPGQGATFSFDLPPATGETREPTPAALPPIGRLTPSIDDVETPVVETAEDALSAQDVVRILAVDDEAINRQVLKNYLTGGPFELITAPSGDEALRLIRAKKFDLVLLDVMMPKVSGFEVCRALREEYPIGELPVLFLTAKNQIEDVVAGLSLGANDFLTKPIAKSELLARIRPHLDLLDTHRHLEDLVQEKMSEIKVLEGILPICTSCKKIRDEDNRWRHLEVYIDSHSEAHFSHGICPDCMVDYHERE